MRHLLWLPFLAVVVFAMRLQAIPFWLLYGRKVVEYDVLEAYMVEQGGIA